MSTDSNSTVLGVVLVVRHGDRSGLYQDPLSYSASNTQITPLGSQQELALGALLRSIYLNDSSESHVQSMSASALFNDTQVVVRADAGDEGEVIVDSAFALTQGLFPNSTSYNTTLANGTTVVGPLDGYQYIPIETVESSTSIEFEGFTSCNTYDTYLSNFYNSSEFSAKAQQSQTFLTSLTPYLDGRAVTLENMWNIFDYMNVNSIHNATFLNLLPDTYLAQARDLANWHEYNALSDPSLTGIGNIAGQTVVPSLVTYLQRVANSSDGLSFVVEAMSYKPFLSLFNMTQAAEQNSSLAAIVDYAAALALEVREGSSGEPVVRFNFKNGTSQDDFTTYNILGTTGDVPLTTFIDFLAPTGINTTAEWCSACSNSVDRGCGALAAATSEGAASVHKSKISPVGAGFLGAGLTLVVVAICLGVLAFLGFLTLGRRKAAVRSGKDMDEKI